MNFFEKLALRLVIQFALRQLEKFKHSIDWAKVKLDVEPLVRKFVPGTWFDQDAVDAVNQFVDLAACALAQTGALDEILNLLAAQDWNGAYDRLKVLLLDVYTGAGCPVKVTSAKGIAALAA